MTRLTPAVQRQRMALRETLRLAVPLHITELGRLSPDMLAGVATASVDIVAAHGDDLEFGGRHCAGAFNALARGLAVAALTAAGGVDYAGLHWCAAPHCRAASRFDHADPSKATPWPDDPPPRPTEHLPDLAT